MARPRKYTKTTNFRSYAGLHPDAKVDPTLLDVEFDNLETAVGQTQFVLNKITRDDGSLAQASVTPESLDNATVAMISSRNARPRGEWRHGTEYSCGDWASLNGATYACLINHVSSDSISFDIASGYWQLVANNALTGYPNTADIFSGDGVTTDFDLSFIFPSPYSFFAFVDGKAQLPGLEFVLANNGRTIRFSSAPQVGVSNVFILASGGAGILSAVANSADDAANSANRAAESEAVAAEKESGAVDAALAASRNAMLADNSASAAADSALAAANSALAAANSALAAANSAAYAAAVMSPVGVVQFFAMSTAPDGWLKANGTEVSRTTYAALFAAIGTTFGAGNGSTTFNLPDLRGEFLRGFDDGRGVDSGRSFGSAQLDELKQHDHTWGNVYTSPYNPTSAYLIGSGGNGKTSKTGGNETRPRNIALLACIKY